MKDAAADVDGCAALGDLARETEGGGAVNTHCFLDDVLNTSYQVSKYILKERERKGRTKEYPSTERK